MLTVAGGRAGIGAGRLLRARILSGISDKKGRVLSVRGSRASVGAGRVLRPSQVAMLTAVQSCRGVPLTGPPASRQRREFPAFAAVVRARKLGFGSCLLRVSRQTIWEQAGTNDVRQIVIAVVNGEQDRIGQMLARLLRVIAEAFDAWVIRAGKDV